MLGKEMHESAKLWIATGLRWVANGAFRQALGYFERAIRVFKEARDLPWLVYASHQKLRCLQEAQEHEKAHDTLQETLQGYQSLQDSYGLTLLLIHGSLTLDALNEGQASLARLRLAETLARFHRHDLLWIAALTFQAQKAMARENFGEVIRLWRSVDGQIQGDDLRILPLQRMAAEAMNALGQGDDGIVFLEDLQQRLMRDDRFADAISILQVLSTIYARLESWQEKNRIAELIHLCGQKIIYTSREVRRNPLSILRAEPRLFTPPTGSPALPGAAVLPAQGAPPTPP